MQKNKNIHPETEYNNYHAIMVSINCLFTGIYDEINCHERIMTCHVPIMQYIGVFLLCVK